MNDLRAQTLIEPRHCPQRGGRPAGGLLGKPSETGTTYPNRKPLSSDSRVCGIQRFSSYLPFGVFYILRRMWREYVKAFLETSPSEVFPVAGELYLCKCKLRNYMLCTVVALLWLQSPILQTHLKPETLVMLSAVSVEPFLKIGRACPTASIVLSSIFQEASLFLQLRAPASSSGIKKLRSGPSPIRICRIRFQSLPQDQASKPWPF